MCYSIIKLRHNYVLEGERSIYTQVVYVKRKHFLIPPCRGYIVLTLVETMYPHCTYPFNGGGVRKINHFLLPVLYKPILEK